MESNRELLFSIIIPVYQAKDTLGECVESCLAQKNVDPKEFEIILVDDGSTDGGSELCDELAKKDELNRITVRHTDNCGVSHARNAGIDMATGRFVIFIDSDDTVSDVFLSNLIKHADESTLLVDESRNFESSQKISGFNYLENSVLQENTHVWGKLFDKKCLNDGNIRFVEGLTIGEDLLFLIDFGIYVGKNRAIRCIAEDDYRYNTNDNGAMNSSFKKSYLDQLVCWKTAEEKLLAVKESISPYSFVSVSVSQVLTALLVVGKVATQAGERDSELDKYAISESRKQIDNALKRRGTFAALSFGHKLKVLILRANPELYIKLYARHKGV